MVKARLASLAFILVLAGCLSDGSGGADPSPTTNNMTHPAPMLVYQKEVEACPQAAGVPVQTDPIIDNFEVPAGFDEVVITYHDSGQGQVSVDIRSEENTRLWGEDQRTVNSAASGVLCGGHSHTGGGITVPVEEGNYNVRIQYTGAVAIHLDIVARVSDGMGDMDHEH